ncbi:hypothetical protein EYB25_000958 [Talaromyces marneffei]|uniref:Uncharacterized protein n=1 Tax=Talaromyces marneffei PM1 TaxID=1077442 RepID=A0A093VLG9_TALMA|nr:uncharacterized protein EYB26_001373 [Talaromyces marneffei]KAE8556257.1 hypothetical protein EYB25_000958 [Talaromyces marneffei]QGA13723.1 hypothetical protein EYB26_001373 [Talaromyces marneffei]
MAGNERWAYNWEGREFTLGTEKYTVKTQLNRMGRRCAGPKTWFDIGALCESKCQVMFKTRCDLDPKDFPLVEDVKETQEIGENHILYEASLYKVIDGIGHGPKVLLVTKRNQTEWMPYPDGQIFFTALKCVPGEDVSRIRNSLTSYDRRMIRFQLTKILETMADNNRVLRTVDLSFLRWDRRTGILYLVDLTHWAYQIVQDEITEKSPFELEFGLWSDEDLESPS